MRGENQVIATICSNWIQGTKRGNANFYYPSNKDVYNATRMQIAFIRK